MKTMNSISMNQTHLKEDKKNNNLDKKTK
jgi:hypothetical protein